jgi:hypothetical protein
LKNGVFIIADYLPNVPAADKVVFLNQAFGARQAVENSVFQQPVIGAGMHRHCSNAASG